jgi:hypothetical protein
MEGFLKHEADNSPSFGMPMMYYDMDKQLAKDTVTKLDKHFTSPAWTMDPTARRETYREQLAEITDWLRKKNFTVPDTVVDAIVKAYERIRK